VGLEDGGGDDEEDDDMYDGVGNSGLIVVRLV
jgi:hypothetical protein